MILTRLRLHNFRPYRGDRELTFAFDATRNVTVITGLTGAGKTSIFYALNWILYGPDGIPEGIVNRGAVREEKEPRAYVELEFLHEGRRYLARRIQRVDPSGIEREQEFTLEEHKAGGRIQEIPNPAQRINVILPSDAKPYFFFDADRFRELVRVGHESQVKEAVRSVLKLRVLERMVVHLRDSSKEYRKNFRDADTSHEQLFNAVEGLESSIEAGQLALASAKETAVGREVLLTNVRLKLGKLSEVAELQRKEDAASDRVDQLEHELQGIDRGLHEAMSRCAPIIAAGGVDGAAKLLDQKRVRGEVPSGIRQQLIDDLIAHGQCICGRHLDDAAVRALQARRQAGVSDAVAEQVAQVSSTLRALEVRSEGALKLLRDFVSRRAALQDRIVDAERELDSIRGQRRGREYTEDVAKLESTRRGLESALIDAKSEVRLHERELESARDELQRTRLRLATAQAKSLAAGRAKSRYDLATRAADAAEGIQERYGADMRKLIEEATDTMFRKFMWKKQQVESVRVSEDYRLEVINRWQGNDLAGLSEGESQMLSLAFLVGMTKVTGEDAPLVIDTPFARLSEAPIANIAGELPGLTQQLVLLVNEREIEPDAERVLAPRIGKRYWLRYDDALGETVIEEQS